MDGAQHLPAFILSKANPQLVLVLSVKMMLIGVGLLCLALYLTLKRPEEMKRRRRLRRFKDADWWQYLFGGVFFNALSAALIIKSLGDLGWELSEAVERLTGGLVLTAALAIVLLLAGRVVEKFNE